MSYGEFKPVLTKLDFVRRYQAGHFGNRAPTWDSLDALNKDLEAGFDWPPDQLFHIRNRVANGPTWYDLYSWQMLDVWTRLESQGLASSLYISCMAPTSKTIFQGEVRQSENHLDLYYSKIAKPMRASLLEGGVQVRGILALSLLRLHCDPSSFDWIQELLDTYQDHVIEFSCYSVNWGTIPNRNTVIWECRGGY